MPNSSGRRAVSRVCPVEVLCESACVMLQYNKQPIAIGHLQRHAIDHFSERGGALPIRSSRKRDQKIVCIGAGPASLACAAGWRSVDFRSPLSSGERSPAV